VCAPHPAGEVSAAQLRVMTWPAPGRLAVKRDR
jgi:hypothetical protein